MRRLLLVCLTVLLVAACGGTPEPQAGTADGGADWAEATVPPAPDATSTDGDEPELAAPERTASEAPDGAPAGGGVLAFTAPTLDGGQLDASSLEGRDVVLWFWAPW